MGGKALKEVFTRRYYNDEFSRVWRHLKIKFLKAGFRKFDLVKSYTFKDSHGDMDILVAYKPEKGNNKEVLTKLIKGIIKPTEVHTNGDVVSMNFNSLQVDIMFISEEDYDICWNFLAYNDLGGFMGKIARGMHLKYGQRGLEFVIYNEDKSKKLKTVTISKDHKSIVEFLGFDYYRFVRGFDTEKDIFSYVYNSRYYRLGAFNGSELNSSQKSRDMDRPMYKELLKFLKNRPNSSTQRPEIEDVISLIKDKFDINLNLIIADTLYLETRKELARAKFNGKLVMDRYHIEPGKELGDMIRKFKLERATVDWVIGAPEDLMWSEFERVNKLKVYKP